MSGMRRAGRCGAGQGQAQRERGPSIGLAGFEPQGSAVRLGQLAADVEPETGARDLLEDRVLLAIEGLEYALGLAIQDPNAVVSNPNDRVFALPARGDTQSS